MAEPIVLLVEDSEDDAFFFHRTFRDSGLPVSVHHAENGEEAIQFLQKTSTSGQLPQVVFLDLKMPVVNGFEVLEWMQEQKLSAQVPVVVLSGSEQSEDKERALQLGAIFYQVKPLEVAHLDVIYKVISARKGIKS